MLRASLMAITGLAAAGCAQIPEPSPATPLGAYFPSSPFPNTAASRAADEFLQEYSGEVMVRHTRRSYLFALAMAQAQGVTVDRELLYIAMTLHDIGLEERFDGSGDFEANGGSAARDWLTRNGFASLAEDVEQAISLHGDRQTANHPRPEFALTHLGSLADVTGSGIADLDPNYVAAVVESYPRRGTKDLLVAMLERQASAKPDSSIGRIYKQVPVSDLIRQAPFQD